MNTTAATANAPKITDWLWVVTLLPLPIIALGQFVGLIVR